MATALFWTDKDSGEFVVLNFDAVTGLTPDDAVDVTDHNVEEGAPVADNARSQPTTLSIEGLVTMVPNARLDDDVELADVKLSVPLRKPGGKITFPLDIPPVPVQISESGLLQAGIGALKGAIFGGPQATATDVSTPRTGLVVARALQQKSPRNRVRAFYTALLKVKDDHSLIDVVSLHRDIRGLMVTRVGAPRTVADGTGIKFQIDLKQIRTASSQTVAAPKPAEPRAQAVSNKGKQGAKADPKPEDKQSLLKGFFSSVGG
jgi:hypothetical protein